MQNEIKKLIRKLFSCKHRNALLNSDEGYCPDCGKYIKKSYYIIRCSCCDIKRKAKNCFNEITPTEKFCTNCGHNEYFIEKCENLNLVDINYAIEIKEVIDETSDYKNVKIWIDGNNIEKEPEIYNTPLLGEIKYLGAN